MSYTTSKDYEELFRLIESGERVPCFYDDGSIRQIGYARESFGVYCIGHDADCYDKEMFINRAKKINAEFLPPSGWIKIESDKDLPPIGEVVLFRLAGNKYTFSGYWNGTIWMCICSCNHWLPGHATHWKPRPEAPEVEA